MDFPVSKPKWCKVINPERLENEYSCSDAIPPSIWQKHHSSIFLLLTIPYMPFILVSLHLFFLSSISQRQAIPITCSAVCSGIKNLKSDSVQIDGIAEVLLSQSCPALVLQLLFQMCICKSSVTESFLRGTISSILKRGKSPTGCSSYRPIAVSCNISKLIEHIALLHLINRTNEGDNQFGFRNVVGC